MDQDTITRFTRRGIRSPEAVFIDDVEIEAMTLQGVYALGMQIKENDPSYYNIRKSISSYTHVFSKPSDCLTILRIWDLKTNAITITNASNASPIVITATAHGFSDDAIVVQHDVGGNTAANGTFIITYIDANSYSLDGSTGNASYTSGGKVYEDAEYPYKIDKKNLREATLNDDRGWYPRGDKIVVDDKDFTNDILCDYIKLPSAITDIPAEYHMGLVGFNVIHLIRIPDYRDTSYADMVALSNRHQGLFDLVQNQIIRTFMISTEPEEIAEGINFDDYL